MKNKVMIAMSGGVDSSVAALLLLEQKYDVTGVTLKLFDNCDIGMEAKDKTCCSLSDIEDAKGVAHRLGFDHFVFNFKDNFCKNVIDAFAKSYIDGLTPNPCIDCNRYVKFDAMLSRAVALENDYLATGHYAKIEYDDISKRYLLKKPVDFTKDQTYVLYSMTQLQLSKTLFPLGGLNKSEVRKIAESNQLVNAKKPDSQDICFVKNGDYASFIESYTNEKIPMGNFIDEYGNVLGKHKGITHYTIGQRKGLGIAFGKPQYVINKNKQDNTVTLGNEELLFSKKLIANDINLIAIENLTSEMRVTAKTRYKQSEQKATLHPIDENKILVEFDNSQRAITPGQAVVFYDDDTVVGGGTIC